MCLILRYLGSLLNIRGKILKMLSLDNVIYTDNEQSSNTVPLVVKIRLMKYYSCNTSKK